MGRQCAITIVIMAKSMTNWEGGVACLVVSSRMHTARPGPRSTHTKKLRHGCVFLKCSALKFSPPASPYSLAILAMVVWHLTDRPTFLLVDTV